MPTPTQPSRINNITWTMNGPDGTIEIGSYDAEVARSFVVGMLAGFDSSGEDREVATFFRTQLANESQEFLAKVVGLGRFQQAVARVVVEDHRQFWARVLGAKLASQEVVEMFDRMHRESLEIMERDVRRMTLQRVAAMSRMAARSALQVMSLRRLVDRLDEQRLVFLQRLWIALGRDPRTTYWHDPHAVMEQLLDAAGRLTEALASGAPAPVAPTTNSSPAWIPSVHEEALQTIVDQCCEVLGCGADSLVLALRLALGVDEVGR